MLWALGHPTRPNEALLGLPFSSAAGGGLNGDRGDCYVTGDDTLLALL